MLDCAAPQGGRRVYLAWQAPDRSLTRPGPGAPAPPRWPTAVS